MVIHDTIIVFDDHDFRGSCVKLSIESGPLVSCCHYHDTSGGIRGSELRDLVGSEGGTVLGVYVLGERALEDEGVRDAIARIRSAVPAIRMVMLCDDITPEAIEHAVRSGLHGLVPTYLPKDVAMAALQFLMAGGHYFPHSTLCAAGAGASSYRVIESADVVPRVAAIAGPDRSADRIASPPVKLGGDGLTSRQGDVLEALCRGCSNKVIARHLGITEATVKIHVRQLLRKYHATNRTQIVIRTAAARGRVDQSEVV